jgi:hypothetical protein
MADPNAFAKLIPGFDFMQGLIKSAGNSLPGVSQWIAPTLDPEELEKRIRDLRTVQFWLEQNAKMLGATIQALEVQRMTLATLSSMNVPVDALRESMAMRVPEPSPAPAPAPEPPVQAAPAPEPAAAPSPPPAAAPPAVDPMQWWGALTQQFSELATNALKDLPSPIAAPAAQAPAPAPVRKSAKPAAKRPATKKAAAAKPAARQRRSP